jgi:hypothetical protein
MIEAKYLCRCKELNIFAIHIYNHKKHEELGSRVWYERIENTFIDAYLGVFQMLSTHPLFFAELSYLKSVTDVFLYEKMGSMAKAHPNAHVKFCIGDAKRGNLLFKKITKKMTVKNKNEQFLVISHVLPAELTLKGIALGLTSEYDYQEVKYINSCVVKALSVYDIKFTHPENREELKKNWKARDWIDNSRNSNVLCVAPWCYSPISNSLLAE